MTATSTYSARRMRRRREAGMAARRADARWSTVRGSRGRGGERGAAKSGAIVLPDAHRDHALQEADLLPRIGHRAHFGQAAPDVLQHHEELLGQHGACTRLAGDVQERWLKLVRVLRVLQVVP